MLNSFKDSLTRVTDLAILFASIFTFLAFITPKEVSIEPLNKSREAITLNQSELRSAIEAVSQSRTNIQSINNLVNQLNGRLAGLDTELDSAISICTTVIEDLSKREIQFLMATHIHDLVDQPEIKNLTNLHLKHLIGHHDQ